MAELTATEARELLASKPVILLPMGSHEDQGPHAPMGDYLSAERMAEIIARRAPPGGARCVVAPVLPFGGADYFGTMPGGIALSQSTLCAVIRDMLACLLRHGLDRIVVINGHAGNVGPIHQMTQYVYRERRVLIPSFYLWQVGPTARAALADRRGQGQTCSRPRGRSPDQRRLASVPRAHASRSRSATGCRPACSTSRSSGFGTFAFRGLRHTKCRSNSTEIAPNGVFRADPRLSSPETGKLLVERLGAIGADFVAHYAARAGVGK